jgi:hypothetical protein
MTTTTSGTSSLARAAQSARLDTRNGGFEACFAGGLDLSEFANTNNNNAATSASAALLQIKAQESVERHREEQEEALMQAIVQQRAQTLESATLSSVPAIEDKVLWAAPPAASRGTTVDFTVKDNNNSIFGALVSMHGGDELNLSKASRSKMKKDKRLAVAKKSNKVSTKKQAMPSSKERGIAKKAKRAKY